MHCLVGRCRVFTVFTIIPPKHGMLPLPEQAACSERDCRQYTALFHSLQGLQELSHFPEALWDSTVVVLCVCVRPTVLWFWQHDEWSRRRLLSHRAGGAQRQTHTTLTWFNVEKLNTCLFMVVLEKWRCLWWEWVNHCKFLLPQIMFWDIRGVTFGFLRNLRSVVTHFLSLVVGDFFFPMHYVVSWII